MSKRRIDAFWKALSSSTPLESVRELIPDDGAGAQEVVVYGFACVLEVGSSGLSILLDRFEADELQKVVTSLEAIGAAHTLADLRRLTGLLDAAMATGVSRLDAVESVAEQDVARGLDARADNHVAELEERLLRFCRSHVEELGAG